MLVFDGGWSCVLCETNVFSGTEDEAPNKHPCTRLFFGQLSTFHSSQQNLVLEMFSTLLDLLYGTSTSTGIS